MNEQSEEGLILHLLAMALIDIRQFASEGNSEACYALADLFHNTPNQLARARAEGEGFKEIIDWLNMRSEQKRMQGWLQNMIKEAPEPRN